MWSYALKRAGTTAVTLLAASVIIFAFIHIVPGDPIYVLLSDTATPIRSTLCDTSSVSINRSSCNI